MRLEREKWSFRGVESEAFTGAWVQAPVRVASIHRPDRALRFERRLGRALWMVLAGVLLWIGLS